VPRAAEFSAAVREACAVYAKTLRMREAALVFGKYNIPIFPVDPRNKSPIPRRDPDPTGKHPRGIPGSGGLYKATTDPSIITDWWTKHPRALIAVPMGPRSGVWCVDVDTGEEHEDESVTAWDALRAEHELFETREHRSASGGPHVFFEDDEQQPLGCCAGDLPKGISVKSRGGYIICPPSVRKGRGYAVHRDIDPIKAPQWLVDAILVDDKGKPKRDPKSPRAHQPFTGTPQCDLDQLAAAMAFISNDNLPWEEWSSWGLALFAASGGSQRGFEIFDEFSARSNKYDPVTTDERWDEISGSPPSATGPGKIFKAALANGWQPKLKLAPPTYTIAANPVAEASDKMREVVREFLKAVDQPVVKYLGNMPLPPIAHAARVDTGVGKTEITIEELSSWLRNGPREPAIYATPRHNLNKPIEQKFFEHGINARIYRGRGADDPLHPGRAMCLNLPAVRLAEKCHTEVASSCCKYKKQYCPYYNECGFQRQLRHRDDVQVWVVAIDTLFHEQHALGKEPPCVIIDESAWQQGLRGVDASEEFKWTVAIDSISNTPPSPTTLLNDLSRFRHRLAEALRNHPQNGGVDSKYLRAQHLDGSACKYAIGQEWDQYRDDIKALGLYPGMPDSRLQAAMNNHALINDIQHARRVIQIWEAARELLNDANITVSGRLTIKRDNGQRVVTWRGISSIKTQFTKPTLLLDATLPDVSVLRAYHERAEVVADIRVALPKSVHIRQLLGAPTSARKMDDAKHLTAVRRHILARHLEFNRPITLVICQQKVEEWLKQSGLPDDIVVEHYNNVTGIDAYRDVRLMLLVGRTQPGPTAVEALSAALTGACPKPANTRGNGFAWYDNVRCGISLRAGGGVATWGDVHPDKAAEAIRWQICEGELVQAFGRARAIRRTAATPLDADLLFDTCLPIEVDEVERWKPPSLLIETAFAEGVMLTSPCDLVKRWKNLWPNHKAAYRTVRAGVPMLPGFEQIEYQLVGPKKNKRIGYFDRERIEDPRAWLETNIGPLV
jgi:putative DNA primase/helicase